jgi:23S rRNA (adenine2503-C2)-methyltransferase
VFPTQRREWFKRLKEAKDKHFLGRFQLQFSLNSTDQEQRKTMIPCNLESFEYLAEFGDFFLESGDRKIVLNFALAEDSQFQAETIINTFPAANFSVKLTPLNPTSRSLATGMKTTLRSSNARLDRDIQKLETAGYEVILSIGDGREDEIGSNCGQSIRRLNKRNELLHS